MGDFWGMTADSGKIDKSEIRLALTGFQESDTGSSFDDLALSKEIGLKHICLDSKHKLLVFGIDLSHLKRMKRGVDKLCPVSFGNLCRRVSPDVDFDIDGIDADRNHFGKEDDQDSDDVVFCDFEDGDFPRVLV